ncbi:MAG: nuclear transport factor 2 family protein [Myxococcota bacterium]|nr:nuclear transport factor 2 family protein [Myxococcota bacterium]
MSAKENASLVKEFYGLVLGGQAEAAIQKYTTPDFVWANPLPEGIPYGGTFEGPEGAARYLELIFATLDLSDFAIDELVAEGDRVVVLGHETAQVKASGRRYGQDWVHVLRLRDGRIEHLREYNDTAAMLSAFE